MPVATRVPHAVFGALVFALAAGTDAADAAKLNVSPKNEKTIFVDPDGKISPRKLTYKLWATEGDSVKWTLARYPGWLSPDKTQGRAKADKSPVRFATIARKLKKLDAGIYDKSIRFTYTDKGKTKKIRRNVVLIVEGDVIKGRERFLNTCSGCHDLQQNMSGPYLIDVYGRVAGTAKGFDYTNALKAYAKPWEERNLNDWLTKPRGLVPGANMYVRLKNPKVRMNVIAYLKAIAP